MPLEVVSAAERAGAVREDASEVLALELNTIDVPM